MKSILTQPCCWLECPAVNLSTGFLRMPIKAAGCLLPILDSHTPLWNDLPHSRLWGTDFLTARAFGTRRLPAAPKTMQDTKPNPQAFEQPGRLQTNFPRTTRMTTTPQAPSPMQLTLVAFDLSTRLGDWSWPRVLDLDGGRISRTEHPFDLPTKRSLLLLLASSCCTGLRPQSTNLQLKPGYQRTTTAQR